MRAYELFHLCDRELMRNLAALVAQDRVTTAKLLAHVAEVDARRLYAPAGYPSMYEYCVHELGLPEQAALKRIRVARIARKHPAIFAAIAAGELNLSGLILLKPFLASNPDHAEALLAAARAKTNAEIELLLAERFPRPDLPTRLEPIAAPPSPVSENEQLSVRTVEAVDPQPLSARTVGTVAPEQLSARTVGEGHSMLKPLAPKRFRFQTTMDQETHDLFRYAQQLLGHRVAPGDPQHVLKRALQSLVAELEKEKFAATQRPRRGGRPARAKRTIPARVKRTVWQRDGGQCTFVNDDGRRCPARSMLEYDHVHPVARGGEATVEGIRLLCRTHNQLEAERMFGAGFMQDKREDARREGQRKRAALDADVVAALQALKFSAAEARRAAALCETNPDASLEARVKLALTYFGVRGTRVPAA